MDQRLSVDYTAKKLQGVTPLIYLFVFGKQDQVAPRLSGGWIYFIPSFIFSDFFNSVIVFLPKHNFSYQNCGIFHNFNVGLF